MNRIDRLLGIITLLQSRKFVPAEKIAEKFGISIRTVYRDVRALCEQGVPVSFEANRGYFIVQGYFLPPVSFTTEEANALLLIDGLVNTFADQSIKSHYSSLLNKVKAVLRTPQKEKLELMHSKIKLQLPACAIHGFEYLSSLQDAILARQIVELDYKNMREEVSKRQVEPIGLIFYAFNWHLIAWCHIRNDYRDFKVSRILKISRPGIPFRKTDHIELGDYMQSLPVDY
jgi:predicted DNA-binding transcriptional regulator YafY